MANLFPTAQQMASPLLSRDNVKTNNLVDRGELPENQREIYPQPTPQRSTRIPTTSYQLPEVPQEEEVDMDAPAAGRLGELGLTIREEAKLAKNIQKLYPKLSPKDQYDMAVKYIVATNPDEGSGNVAEGPVEQLGGETSEELPASDDLMSQMPESMQPGHSEPTDTTLAPGGGSKYSIASRAALASQQAGSQKEKKGILDKSLSFVGNLLPTTAVNTLIGGGNLPDVPLVAHYKEGDDWGAVMRKGAMNLPSSAINLGLDVGDALLLNADDTLVGIKTILQGLVEKGQGKETENTTLLDTVWDDMSGPYKDAFDGGDMELFKKMVAEDPAMIISDIAGLLAAGAGVAAKGAALTGKIAKTSKFSKISDTLQKVSRVSDAVDPAYWAARASIKGISTQASGLARGGRIIKNTSERGTEKLGQTKEMLSPDNIKTSMAGGPSNIEMAKRTDPEFFQSSKDAIEAYTKDNSNPDPLMRGGQQIEEAVDGAITKPKQRVGQKLGEIRETVADYPVDGTEALNYLTDMFESQYNAKLVDGKRVPAKGTKSGLPKAGKELDAIQTLYNDLAKLSEGGGIGSDIKLIFDDLNRAYKELDAMSDQGTLYNKLLKSDLFDVREELYKELDKYIDSNEYTKLNKEYKDLTATEKRMNKLYNKAATGPSGELLPTNSMIKRIFSSNPSEAKMYLDELSKYTGDDWYAKVKTLGAVSADMVNPNIFEEIFDLRPSQVMGGSRFFKNDLIDRLLKWGAKEIIGNPTDILESYIGQNLEQLPKEVQVKGFDNIEDILREGQEMYAGGAAKETVVDHIASKMDELFGDEIMSEQKATSFSPADKAKLAGDDLPFNDGVAKPSSSATYKGQDIDIGKGVVDEMDRVDDLPFKKAGAAESAKSSGPKKYTSNQIAENKELIQTFEKEIKRIDKEMTTLTDKAEIKELQGWKKETQGMLDEAKVTAKEISKQKIAETIAKKNKPAPKKKITDFGGDIRVIKRKLETRVNRHKDGKMSDKDYQNYLETTETQIMELMGFDQFQARDMLDSWL